MRLVCSFLRASTRGDTISPKVGSYVYFAILATRAAGGPARSGAGERSSRDGQGSPPPRQIPCNQLRSCPAVRLGRTHVPFDKPRLQLAAPLAEGSERGGAHQ